MISIWNLFSGPNNLTLYTYGFWTLFEMTVAHSSVLMVVMFFLGMVLAALISTDELPVADELYSEPDTREEKSTRIIDVWTYNIEHEFASIAHYLQTSDKSEIIIGLDTKPKPESATFQQVRRAILNGPLQLGISLRTRAVNAKPETHVWQFNLQTKRDDGWLEEGAISIPLLRKYMAESKIQGMQTRWVSFGGICDFSFLLYIICGALPEAFVEFEALLEQYFPRAVDLKYILPTSSLQTLAVWLRLRYGKQWSAGSQAMCTLHCFLALDKHLQHKAFCEPNVRQCVVDAAQGIGEDCDPNSVMTREQDVTQVPADTTHTGNDVVDMAEYKPWLCESPEQMQPTLHMYTRHSEQDKARFPQIQTESIRKYGMELPYRSEVHKAYTQPRTQIRRQDKMPENSGCTPECPTPSYQRAQEWLDRPARDRSDGTGLDRSETAELMNWVVSSVAKEARMREKIGRDDDSPENG